MAIDIKAKAMEVVQKAASDKEFREQLQKDPVKAIESVVGIDLPDDQINAILAQVKGKLDINSVATAASAVLGAAGKGDLGGALSGILGNK